MRYSRWIGACAGCLAILAVSLSVGWAEGKSGAASQPGAKEEKTAAFVTGQKIALNIRAASAGGPVLTAQWAEFNLAAEAVRLKVHTACQGSPKTTWIVEVYLLDQDGKPMRMAGRRVMNSGKATQKGALEQQDWETSVEMPSPERVKSVRVTVEAKG